MAGIPTECKKKIKIIDIVLLEQWAMQMKFYPKKMQSLLLDKNNPQYPKHHVTKSNGTANTLKPTEPEKCLGIFKESKLSLRQSYNLSFV